MRWLNALRSQYLKQDPNRQKVRLAARVGVRALTARQEPIVDSSAVDDSVHDGIARAAVKVARIVRQNRQDGSSLGC